MATPRAAVRFISVKSWTPPAGRGQVHSVIQGEHEMSTATGGRADKLGNRYEGLWVANTLIRLLAEEIRTVQMEALGDDERGVDLWVTNNDGWREAYQCKRKNRT